MSLLPFHVAHAAAAGPADAVKAIIAEVEGLATEGYALGIVYATDAFADSLDAVAGSLKQATGIPHWVGTTGIGVAATGREYFDEPALAVMLLPFGEDDVKIVPHLANPDSIPNDVLSWSRMRHPLLGLVHADPRNGEAGEIIAGLAEATGTFLVGGLTSARGSMRQLADTTREEGVSGVLFAAGVNCATDLSQGCTPIGPVRTVTKSERNILFEIDGEPATELLLADAGDPPPDDLQNALASVHAAFPLPGSRQADYLVRNLMGLDLERGAVAVGTLVDPGDRVVFCRRDRTAATDDLNRMLTELRGRLSGPPRGGVYVSCLARGPNLFGPNSEELRMIQAALGDFPLVGFFANGEISAARLHGYTGVLTLFE